MQRYKVTRDGGAVNLTRIEFDILATLAQNAGQVFSRSQLIDHLHGVAYEGFERSIDSHIKNIRRKLEPDPSEPRYVLTIFGVGYKFNDEV